MTRTVETLKPGETIEKRDNKFRRELSDMSVAPRLRGTGSIAAMAATAAAAAEPSTPVENAFLVRSKRIPHSRPFVARSSYTDTFRNFKSDISSGGVAVSGDSGSEDAPSVRSAFEDASDPETGRLPKGGALAVVKTSSTKKLGEWESRLWDFAAGEAEAESGQGLSWEEFIAVSESVDAHIKSALQKGASKPDWLVSQAVEGASEQKVAGVRYLSSHQVDMGVRCV